MIVIGFVYLLFVVGYLVSRNYEKEFMKCVDKKKESLWMFYPFALYLAHFVDGEKSEGYKKRMEQIKLLHANEDHVMQYKLFMAKKFGIVLFCILIFNSLGLCLLISNQKEPIIQNGTITRPSYGEDASEVDLDVALTGKEDYVQQHVTISVLPREYTKEEFEKVSENAKEYLNKAILGQNVSTDKIYYPLNLISSIPDSGLSVEWQFNDGDLIETDGAIHHEGLTQETKIVIMAVMKSGDFQKEYEIPLTVLPEVLSKEDQLLYHFNSELTSANETGVTSDKMVLPDTVDSHSVYYEEKSAGGLGGFCVFAILVLLLVYIMMEQQLVQQKEERDIEIMLDYPELINKFTLLIGAGMTIKKAWEKIVSEYEERKALEKTTRRYAYEELKVTLSELNNGVTESKAYEAFGRRMQLMPYMKFSSMLAQNVSKGMDGIMQALELEAYTAFEERKELAKRLGEKAGTKLLLPMGIMLCLVMAMIIIPAMQMM